jgi:sugar/nucleoside kinase (ribokinase family)
MTGLDVLVLADVNPDLVVTGRGAVFEFGQVEQRADAARLVVGGSGTIFACAAARLGLRVAVAGVVGADVFGRFMLEELSRRGVNVDACRVADGSDTGVSVILSRGEDRGIVTAPGTIGDLRAEDVDRGLLRSARHVHVGAYYLQTGLQPGLPELLDDARAFGLTSSLDANWDPSGSWDGGLRDAVSRVDTFFPNAEEVRAITGQEDVERGALELSRLGPAVVVKLGGAGALVARDRALQRLPAGHADVVDTVGAGDTFDAGVVRGLLAGWPLERAVALGVAAGTLSTRASGGTAGQPTLGEAVEAMVEP